MRKIVILTGAGISAESGVPTFRAEGGLWAGHRVEEVATPEGFHRDPTLVHAFYNRRRRQLGEVGPNEAHRALARLEAEHEGEVVLVTQNVDDLHERGGSKRILHMHGQLSLSRCESCQAVAVCRTDLTVDSECGSCGRAGGMRPQIVWFGEMPFYMDEIERHLREADLFVAVGTSGQVYPAAGFVTLARECGARTIEVNLEETCSSAHFHESLVGPAGTVLPALIQAILAGDA